MDNFYDRTKYKGRKREPCANRTLFSSNPLLTLHGHYIMDVNMNYIKVASSLLGFDLSPALFSLWWWTCKKLISATRMSSYNCLYKVRVSSLLIWRHCSFPSANIIGQTNIIGQKWEMGLPSGGPRSFHGLKSKEKGQYWKEKRRVKLVTHSVKKWDEDFNLKLSADRIKSC